MMNSEKIGVGIIGANPTRGWASRAHIPALKALPQFKVTAISTSRQESANETARLFQIPQAFTDPWDLSSHPDVDLVVITVKVPEHYKLVKTALSAGKHVYCEWPLAKTTEEALDLVKIAERQGIRHIVGLQARTHPVLNYVKDLIKLGYVGEVLSVNARYSLSQFGSSIIQPYAYLFDQLNGVNHLTVASAHTLDALDYCLGEFIEVSAVLGTQYKEIKVIETGEVIQATAPDHVLVSGILENGAIVSSYVRTGNTGELTIEISGTEGDLVIASKESIPGGIQMDQLILKSAQGKNKDLEELPIPEQYFLAPKELYSSPAYSVAQLYMQFAKDLKENTHTIPDFKSAIRLHKLLDKIQKASATGIRQIV